jgi:glycosyltransferase involved in cell wall biosynthesis
MVDNNTDFYKHVNNFAKTEHVLSLPIFEVTNVTPRVTIAIPTYKRVECLKEAINSALGQKKYEDFDIIVVDDNLDRNDCTENFMQSYSGNPKISYYKNSQNLGQAGNWNRLFLLAKGTYVLMLHDDDVLAPTFLSEMMRIIDLCVDVDILKSGQYIWDQNRNPFPKFSYSKKKYALVKGKIQGVFNSFGDWTPTGIIFRKDIVLNEGGFNSDFFPSIDYSFLTLLFEKYNALLYKKKLFVYRRGVNESLNLVTQKKWIYIDYFLKKQIGAKIKYPRWFISFVCHKDAVVRYKGITEIEKEYQCTIDGYELFRPSKFRLCVYFLFSSIYNIYWTRIYKIASL